MYTCYTSVFLVRNDTSEKKQEQEQLKNSEKKYQSLIEKRNELNQLAKLIREERDMLNNKRNEMRETLKKNKKQRDELVTKMRQHKEKRNQLQQQAKQLIEGKRKKKGDIIRNLPLRVEELKADIQMLEYRQETTPMSPQEENELIDDIRAKKTEYNNLKKQMDKQKLIETDLSDTDQAITELFKKADEEHEKVQKYYKESQKKHEEYMKLVNEVAASINESNKKHKKYVEIRDEAQRYHEKAIEMRSKIISVKQDRKKRWEESKQLIRDQNVKARKLVMDKEKLDKAADDSVSALKKGQKISF